MKKNMMYLSFLFLLFFCGCIKKYSCKCTTTLRQDGYYPKTTETIEDIQKHSSKKKATQICDNTAKQMQANTRLLFSANIDVATRCELKDY